MFRSLNPFWKSERTGEELYEEKLERLETATEGKKPDRVPIAVNTIYFPAKYAGITYHDLFYDHDKFTKAAVKFAKDFNWDAVGFLRSFDSATLGLTLAGYDSDLGTNLLPLWPAEGYTIFLATNILPIRGGSFRKTPNHNLS